MKTCVTQVLFVVKCLVAVFQHINGYIWEGQFVSKKSLISHHVMFSQQKFKSKKKSPCICYVHACWISYMLYACHLQGGGNHTGHGGQQASRVATDQALRATRLGRTASREGVAGQDIRGVGRVAGGGGGGGGSGSVGKGLGGGRRVLGGDGTGCVHALRGLGGARVVGAVVVAGGDGLRSVAHALVVGC